MALFRFHRGGLSESLATTKIVKNKEELLLLIKDQDPVFCEKYFLDDIKIEPYGNEMDNRIGWYTQIVTVRDPIDRKFYPKGFLSEPFD